METAVQAEAPRSARWEDFIDIFISPAELFRRRGGDSWVVPIIVLGIASLALYYALFPVMTPLWQASAALNASPEQLAQMQQAGDAMKKFALISGLFSPIIIAVMMLLVAGVAWSGGRMFSVDLRYRQALTTVTWAGMISIPQQLAIAVSVMLATRSGEALHPAKHMNVGPLRFMNPETLPDALVPLIGRIDVFAIWQMVVVAIGVQVITGASRGTAFGVAALTWIAYALPQIIGAAF